MKSKFPVVLALAAVVAALGYAGWRHAGALRAEALPDDVTVANGRIEVERVDVSAKLAGRVATIAVREGDYLAKGAPVAELDQTQTRAELAAAEAEVERAFQAVAQARAAVASRAAELALAEVQLRRAEELRTRDFASQAEADQRLAARNVAAAAVDAAEAAVGGADAARKVAEAQVAQIRSRLDDLTLTAPIAGRVEYKLVQPGEVVAAGGRVVTLLDLTDVSMTVFLPTSSAGRVRLGGEARIVLDAGPEFVIPATVTFVAAEAQFTPKTVETSAEREKLMYRVKVGIAPDLLGRYRDYVKAGLTGVAYVGLGPDVAWPERLAPRLPDAGS